MSEGAKWCVRVATGVLGYLCLSEGDYWCRSVPTSTYWCLSVPNGIWGSLRVRTGV